MVAEFGFTTFKAASFSSLRGECLIAERQTLRDTLNVGPGYLETFAHRLFGLNAFWTSHTGSFIWRAAGCSRSGGVEGDFIRDFEPLSRQPAQLISEFKRCRIGLSTGALIPPAQPGAHFR